MPIAARKFAKPWRPVALSCLWLSACSGSQEASLTGGTGVSGTEPGGSSVPVGSTSEEDSRLPPRLPVAAPPRVMPPEPDPEFDGCLSITIASGAESRGAVSILRWSYDPGMSLVTSVPSDEHGVAQDSSDPNESHALYWKWDAEGRVMLRAGGGSGYRAFRQTTERDEHGNVVALRAVYLDAIDLAGDVLGQSYFAAEYSNEYNEAGQLVRHRAVHQEGSDLSNYAYSHDALGRCEVISNEGQAGGIELRDYDAAGRLSHRQLEGLPRGGEAPVVNSVVTYQYDDLGRLRSASETAQPGRELLASLSLTYRADGSFSLRRGHRLSR
jgi:hypothetical protein